MTAKSYQDTASKIYPTNEQLAEMDRDLVFRPSDASNARTLTAEQVEQFNERGYIKPLAVFDEAEADDLRCFFDGILAEALAAGADSYSIVSAHMKHGRIYDLMFHTRVAAYMRDLLGENVVCWGAHFFCKMPSDDRQVSWHQDASYWPISPSRTATTWLAIDDVDRQNACMQFVEGSHRYGHIEHRPSTEEDRNVLYRSVDGAERYGDLVDVELRAGQMSLHSDLLLHGSAPNRSNRRRCGLALRFAPVEVRASMNWNAEGVIVSGTDPEGHWGNPPRPSA